MGTIIAMFISLVTLTSAPINTVTTSDSTYNNQPISDETSPATCNIGSADIEGL